MQNNLYNITIALAGMIQTTTLAKEFAQTGKMDEDAFHTSLYSITQLESQNIASIYGGLQKLKLGLESLIELFEPATKKTRLQMRYLLSLIQMQKKIMRNPKIRNQLQERIQQIAKQADYFSLTHPTVISNFADCYLDAISPFRFRVFILGNQRVLTVKENLEKIRALLLAGIRSAVLWRQMGGSRLQLLFSRPKMKKIAEDILIEINKNPF